MNIKVDMNGCGVGSFGRLLSFSSMRESVRPPSMSQRLTRSRATTRAIHRNGVAEHKAHTHHRAAQWTDSPLNEAPSASHLPVSSPHRKVPSASPRGPFDPALFHHSISARCGFSSVAPSALPPPHRETLTCTSLEYHPKPLKPPETYIHWLLSV
jgi:hypothetical protein